MNTERWGTKPALVISFVALLIALGGTAWALGVGSVKSVNIAKHAVKARHITKHAVRSRHMANDSVNQRILGGGAVGRGELQKSSVGGDQIADGAVNGFKIATSAVDSSKIKNSSITGSDIKNGAITSSDFKGNVEPEDDMLSSDMETVNATLTIQANLTQSQTVDCPSGKKAVSGGWSDLDTGNTVSDSYATTNGWNIKVIDTNDGDTVTVKVVCSRIS